MTHFTQAQLSGMPKEDWTCRPRDEKSLLRKYHFNGRDLPYEQCDECFSVFLDPDGDMYDPLHICSEHNVPEWRMLTSFALSNYGMTMSILWEMPIIII